MGSSNSSGQGGRAWKGNVLRMVTRDAMMMSMRMMTMMIGDDDDGDDHVDDAGADGDHPDGDDDHE